MNFRHLVRMTHHLKTWPEYFTEVICDLKRFEVRRDDRDFQVGDHLVLEEWDPATKQYTGREAEVYVTYILRGPAFGIEAGTVVMSFHEFQFPPSN